jgi:hypothetical protein
MPNRSPERTKLYAGILTTAVEGGTGYWAQVSDYKWDCEPADTVVTLYPLDDDEDGYIDEGIVITVDTIAKGFQLLFKQVMAGEVKNEYFVRFVIDTNAGKWNEVDYDAAVADVIVQLALFNGEVVYG